MHALALSFSSTYIGVKVCDREVDGREGVPPHEIRALAYPLGPVVPRVVLDRERWGCQPIEPLQACRDHLKGGHELGELGHLAYPRREDVAAGVARVPRLVRKIPRKDRGVLLVQTPVDRVAPVHQCL